MVKSSEDPISLRIWTNSVIPKLNRTTSFIFLSFLAMASRRSSATNGQVLSKVWTAGSGYCKRPVVVVPQPMARCWVKFGPPGLAIAKEFCFSSFLNGSNNNNDGQKFLTRNATKNASEIVHGGCTGDRVCVPKKEDKEQSVSGSTPGGVWPWDSEHQRGVNVVVVSIKSIFWNEKVWDSIFRGK